MLSSQLREQEGCLEGLLKVKTPVEFGYHSTIACLAGMFLICATARAAEVSVSWTFAANNVDGTPLTDLAGAKVYYGASSSNYTQVVDVSGGQPGQACSFTVTGLVAGVTYYFNGTAYNTAGLESDFCAEVAKIAVDPVINLAPVVSAGPDGTTQNQVEFPLEGSVSDDGVPAGFPLTSSWTVVSGPGSVTFENVSSPATTAVFSKAGAYILRLTATDGQKTSSDEATFDVKYQSPKKLRTVK